MTNLKTWKRYWHGHVYMGVLCSNNDFHNSEETLNTAGLLESVVCYCYHHREGVFLFLILLVYFLFVFVFISFLTNSVLVCKVCHRFALSTFVIKRWLLNNYVLRVGCNFRQKSRRCCKRSKPSKLKESRINSSIVGDDGGLILQHRNHCGFCCGAINNILTYFGQTKIILKATLMLGSFLYLLLFVLLFCLFVFCFSHFWVTKCWHATCVIHLHYVPLSSKYLKTNLSPEYVLRLRCNFRRKKGRRCFKRSKPSKLMEIRINSPIVGGYGGLNLQYWHHCGVCCICWPNKDNFWSHMK